MLLAEIVVRDEYVLALFVAMLAQVVGGVTWLFKLGVRMTKAEDGIQGIQASLSKGAERMDRLETSQGKHTTQLAVIEAGVEDLRRGMAELRQQQTEVLTILRSDKR